MFPNLKETSPVSGVLNACFLSLSPSGTQRPVPKLTQRWSLKWWDESLRVGFPSNNVRLVCFFWLRAQKVMKWKGWWNSLQLSYNHLQVLYPIRIFPHHYDIDPVTLGNALTSSVNTTLGLPSIQHCFFVFFWSATVSSFNITSPKSEYSTILPFSTGPRQHRTKEGEVISYVSSTSDSWFDHSSLSYQL